MTTLGTEQAAAIGPAERRAILRNHLAGRLGENAELVQLGDDTAVVVFKARPRHGIQALLSVLTFGLWLPVWLILAVALKDSRHIVQVGEDGRVTWDAPGACEPAETVERVVAAEPEPLCTPRPAPHRPAPRRPRTATRPATRRRPVRVQRSRPLASPGAARPAISGRSRYVLMPGPAWHT